MNKGELIKKIKNTEWHADWSGPFPIVEVSTASRIYFYGLKKVFSRGFTNFFVVYKKGIAQVYLPESEYKKLGRYFGERLKSANQAKAWANEFIRLADEIYAAIRVAPRDFLSSLESLDELYAEYGAYNVATKISFDVLGSKLKADIKKLLIDSRKYSETFYSENSEIFSKSIKLIKKPEGYTNNLLLMMTREELIKYIKTGELPDSNILKERYKYCGIYFSLNKTDFLYGDEVEEIEKYWAKGKGLKVLTGVTAFKGRVKGRCRVIIDYAKVDFKTGDILVTGMTDPRFVPIMKKASAIITDGGGLLSHAAIVARELKKPCVIGTKIATKVLKDGDMVEVDANSGIIKIIK